MSDDRWDDLGVSRRGFLKRVVGGAFIAPVVVSFGLDGVAQAGTQSFPNSTFQCLPNQVLGHIPDQGLNNVLTHDPRCQL